MSPDALSPDARSTPGLADGPTAVIVIFGAAVHPGGVPSPTLLQRTEAAFACGGLRAAYLPTGAVGRHPPSEASVMAALLRQWGVPADHIKLEEQSRSTLASAYHCADLLRVWPETFGLPVKVASSGYHLPRCLLLLRLAGVAATSCPAPGLPPKRWYWQVRESVALPVDVSLALFRRKPKGWPRRRTIFRWD